MILIIAKWLLALFVAGSGVIHFVSPKPYLVIMPRVLPAKLALVYISGAAELLLGIGLLVAQTQQLAAWGLIALFIAIFPANVSQAMRKIPYGKAPLWLIWARLPFQLGLIAWAYVYT